MRTVARRITSILLSAVAATSCRAIGREPRPPIIQPGAPGSSSRVISRDDAVDLSNVQYTKADVQFMQSMIHHHAQALDMTALISSRTSREDIELLGGRIELSQADEIKMMQRWLEVRGQEVTSEHAHHLPGAVLMPGMLTPEEMDGLAAAKGAEFDRLFLEGMMKHHGGALSMVEELFSTPGAGQESEIFAFASDVVSDQKMEIDRMGAMLKEPRK